MNVRPTSEQDVALLPEVERSAGQAFRDIPELAWIADDDVQSIEQHRAYARAGASWVVVDGADRPFGFLSAEACGDELHVWELAVRHDHQGKGAGRALIEAAVDHARRHELDALTLTTFREVAWNEPLYAHMGFTTLDKDNTGERLARILQDEAQHGLAAHRRCAMKLELKSARDQR